MTVIASLAILLGVIKIIMCLADDIEYESEAVRYLTLGFLFTDAIVSIICGIYLLI
jgi:hypothetical protein